MWAELAALLLIAYVPGALLLRTPFAARERRASLPAEERVFWALILSVGLSSIGVLLLASDGLYRFERLLVFNGLWCAACVALARGRLSYRGEAPRPTLTGLIPVGLVAACLWMYFPPAEYVMGGKDPGTYMNEGVQIAQRGSLVVHDPVVAEVPAPTRDLFFPQHPTSDYYGLRFMGFFVLDPQPGTVVGQFPQLFPASIALGYGLNGLSGARQAIGAWAILAVLAVYFVGVRLFGRPAAAAAAALLSINVVQVWFARYPNAEIPMQALLFAGLLAFARAHQEDDRFFAPVAASLFGLLLFLKPVDAVPACAAIGASLVLGWAWGLRPRLSFLVTFGLWALVAALYLVSVLPPYLALPRIFLSNLAWWQWVLFLVGGLAVATISILAARLGGPWLITWLPTLLSVIAVVAAAYAYWWRMPSGRLAEHDAMALRSFAWYITPAGLAAAVLGFVFTIHRRFTRDVALFLTALTFAFVFFYKIRIVPEHFWMMRRFLAVMLPAALLFASGLALIDIERRWRQWFGLRLVVPLALLLVLAWQFWQASSPVRHHVEYAGLIPQLEKLATRFTDDDLVLVESRNSSDLHVLGLPLAYIYARNVLVLNSPRPDRIQLEEFLDWARQRYKDVYFMGGGGTDLLSRTIGVTPVASDRFQIAEYESPRNAYPRSVRHKEFDFGIYRFIQPRQTTDEDWFELDVGTMDDLHVVRFHAKERMANGATFRWTRDISYISIVNMRGDARTLLLWLNDGRRPAKVAPADVEVSIDDDVIGRQRVGPDFKPYTFNIPADVAQRASSQSAPARLKITTNVWNPRAALGTPDDRDLGVMVERVDVR